MDLDAIALSVVNTLGKDYKVSPYVLARLVPGMCHTHVPDDRIHANCAYCARKGNVLCTSTTSRQLHDDDLFTKTYIDTAAFVDTILDTICRAVHMDVATVRLKFNKSFSL